MSSKVDRVANPQEETQHVDPQSLLRLRQVLKLVPIGASTWWAGVRTGRFPKPVKLGPRTTAWRASEVLALIERGTTRSA